MLIKFKVANFLSFDSVQEFSMIAGSVKNKDSHILDYKDLKLLKFSSVYGANASGKSNLLKAINFQKNIVLNGLKSDFRNAYCRSHQKNKEKVSTFECEIKLNDKFYSYGFDILLSENSIRSEWLYEINHKEEIPIYMRELNKEAIINEDYFQNDEEIVKRLKVYASDIQSQDNILFLTIMNKNKESLYKEVTNIILFKKLYNWFDNVLMVIFPQHKIDNTRYWSSQENIQKINDIISTFGTGISMCKIVDSSIQELNSRIPPEIYKNMFNTMMMEYISKAKDNNFDNEMTNFWRVNDDLYIVKIINSEKLAVQKVVLKHKNDDGEYLFAEESDGTRRLFDLIEILLNTENERVYFIDELDRCLHPQLSYEFVRRFLENNLNKTTQLIVTTHESRLLNFNLLRRDEIWFANREENSPTHLYSLEDYNERFDRKIDKAYLDGRYGGVPIFETIFPIGDEKERCM